MPSGLQPHVPQVGAVPQLEAGTEVCLGRGGIEHVRSGDAAHMRGRSLFPQAARHI